MSTFDHKRTALNMPQPAPAQPAQPNVRFVDVMNAVDQAPDLTLRVRQNLRAAVTRTAEKMSPLGLHGPVVVSEIGKKLNRLAPAQLGFKTDGALSAYKSNLRRALKLAGITVMPGRHVKPLSGSWQGLFDTIPKIEAGGCLSENPIRIQLSRFAHVASEQDWLPGEVGPEHLKRFGILLTETCLNSKSTRVLRETAAAWSEAQSQIGCWPANSLGHPERQRHGYAMAWGDFPGSLRADVEAFVARGDLAYNDKGRPLKPLRERSGKITAKLACALHRFWSD